MHWLIGSGLMSVEYSKVLQALNVEYEVIGRGKDSSREFTNLTGKNVIEGGVDLFLQKKPSIANTAIVSVGIEGLYNTTLKLIEYGVKRILVEKPGGLTNKELDDLQKKCYESNCEIYIAYNRRFFSSVIEAKKMIEADGGVTSFDFEFTEWSHIIEKLNKSKKILNKWFIANSTHVADLAFYLGGKPKEITSYVEGGLNWHLSGAIFSGAGYTENKSLFSYNANWESAGRWSLNVLTNKKRYIFRPMESVFIQKRGEIDQVKVNVDDSLDIKFKPGLYKQVEAFLNKENDDLCSLSYQKDIFRVYEKMAGYK